MTRSAALWAAAFLLPCSLAAGRTLTPAQYGRILRDTAQRLEQAAEADENTEARAKAALGNLPQRAEIRSGPGAPAIEADNVELLRTLERQVSRDGEGIRGAAQVLRNLQHGVEFDAQPARGDARQALARVLARREFQPSRLLRLRLRLAEWFARALEFIFGWLPETGAGASLPYLIARVVLWGALGLAAAAALFLLVRMAIRLAGTARRQPPAEPEARAVKPHSAWLADAEAALEARDYRAAVRALYMAALMRLDDAGHLSYDDAHTDGRFVRALRGKGRSDLAQALAALSQLFAAVWYGLAPVGPQECAAARERWNELEAMTSP